MITLFKGAPHTINTGNSINTCRCCKYLVYVLQRLLICSMTNVTQLVHAPQFVLILYSPLIFHTCQNSRILINSKLLVHGLEQKPLATSSLWNYLYCQRIKHCITNVYHLLLQCYKFGTCTGTGRMLFTSPHTSCKHFTFGDSRQLINAVPYSLPVHVALQGTYS